MCVILGKSRLLRARIIRATMKVCTGLWEPSGDAVPGAGLDRLPQELGGEGELPSVFFTSGTEHCAGRLGC